MKILLIQPSPEKAVLPEMMFTLEPLALEYIGAGVSDRHEARLLDMRFDKNFTEAITSFNPDVVGLSGYTYHVNTILKICREIKILKPSVLIVIGGPMPL